MNKQAAIEAEANAAMAATSKSAKDAVYLEEGKNYKF